MNRREALSWGCLTLQKTAFLEASLETEVLLRHALHIDRVQLYQEPLQTLTPDAEESFRVLIARRLLGEPTAYLTGLREFFGLDFFVDPRVLIPRPESEMLVDQALDYVRCHPVSSLADVGTGSGALAVSLAKQLPELKIYATDISPEALEVALLNCGRHGVDNVELRCGDLLEALPEPVDVILANLPYIRRADLLQVPSAGYEPALALDGGGSGLDVLLRFSRQLPGFLKHPACLLMEIGLDQAPVVRYYLQTLCASACVETLTDLAGLPRVLKLTIP